jgi:hypothetical protein
MKRVIISLSLLMGILVPIVAPASAAEKCLAPFADSEWANGTPAGVKSLLGFDLVEKITKTPYFDGRIHPYFSLGEHTATISYNYVGKNCLSRDVKISKDINATSVVFEYQTFNDYINRFSADFVQQENSSKYYTSLKDYFSSKVFTIQTKQLLPGGISGALGLYQVLRTMQKDLRLVPPRNAFVYFPTKCAYQRINDSNGIPTKEKIFSFFVGGQNPPNQVIVNFENEGECTGVLMEAGYDPANRPAGVAEKIADIKYVVNSRPSNASITCTKGKLVKNVSGKNPKCPAGYKVKK